MRRSVLPLFPFRQAERDKKLEDQRRKELQRKIKDAQRREKQKEEDAKKREQAARVREQNKRRETEENLPCRRIFVGALNPLNIFPVAFSSGSRTSR